LWRPIQATEGKKQSSVARILDPINTWIVFWSRIMEAVSFSQYLPDTAYSNIKEAYMRTCSVT
jgi:hypothetical protein